MSFSMATLLIHGFGVPEAAKKALVAAQATPPEHRRAYLASAARSLYVEAGLDCADARELVGLEVEPGTSECGCA